MRYVVSFRKYLRVLSQQAARIAFPTLPFAALLLVATLSMLGGYLLGRRHPSPTNADRLDVYVVNVQEGEASWIRTPGGHAIVIGAGPPDAGGRVLSELHQAGIRKIDLLVLPYPYAEAIGGAADILAAIPCDQVIEPDGPIVNQWQERVRVFCTRRNIRVRHVSNGDQLVVDRVRITILAPGTPRVKAAPTAANNSIVLKVRWHETSFLWAGGIERAGEDALLSRVPDVSATWLRIARFGTYNASSAEFLSAVSPEMVVVSVGVNNLGYPSVETMARLAATGAKIYETSATPVRLHFVSDGSRIAFTLDP